MEAVNILTMYPVHLILDKIKKDEIYPTQFIALSNGFAVATNGSAIVRAEIQHNLTEMLEARELDERKEYFIDIIAYERMWKAFKAEKSFLKVQVWTEEGELYSDENRVQHRANDNFYLGFHEGCGTYTTVKVFNNSDLARMTVSKAGYPYWQRVWNDVANQQMLAPIEGFSIDSEFTEKIIKCFDKPHALNFLISESSKAVKIVSGENSAILMPILQQIKIEFPNV